MHKKIKISILVMLLILLCTLFNGCMNHIKTISVNNKDYFNALKCDNDEYNLVISERSAVDMLLKLMNCLQKALWIVAGIIIGIHIISQR